jgi:hypothetical protein
MGKRGIDLMIIIIVTMTTTTINAIALDEDLSDLKELTSSFDDPHMNSYDLAFYLATHGYNAVPKEGHVELVLKDSTYILTPNGEKPELCEFALNASSQVQSRYEL